MESNEGSMAEQSQDNSVEAVEATAQIAEALPVEQHPSSSPSSASHPGIPNGAIVQNGLLQYPQNASFGFATHEPSLPVGCQAALSSFLPVLVARLIRFSHPLIGSFFLLSFVSSFRATEGCGHRGT